ncbi:metallophosphoesterase [Granulicella cerasi]|uniref:Metallophosphoesterase n=1 Tax=Granulicella cerasi TaxID=741063 RepID=A0ABW1ZEA6_9BACT|nr:metallophosphoesterase [Granulicella cerasi]
MSDLLEAPLSRRRFLKQTLAFSALASLAPHELIAQPAPDPSAQHFLMWGDWGWNGDTAPQKQVAQQMQKYAADNKFTPVALLNLGDSFYGKLPGGANDPRWQWQFEDTYPAAAFPGPIFSVMGNHDYQVDPVNKRDAELAYPKTRKTRWTQPNLWYSFEYPAKNPIIRIIALDSNVRLHAFNIPPNFTLSHEDHAAQLQWFEAEIAKPTNAPFTAVMAHHPIFSNSRHGDHPILGREWEPLLRKYRQHFYLAGHDHDLQHLEFKDHPTSFVCSGAGGADLYDIVIPDTQRGPYAHRIYGFTHMEFTPQQAIVRHVGSNGQVLHAFIKGVDHSVKMIG